MDFTLCVHTQLREFSGASLGVLVTLPPPPATEEDSGELEAVVGVCAPVESDRIDSELEARGLPSPNWASTVASVLQHYPAGVSVAGIWVKVQPDEVESLVKSLVKLLIEKTKLMVNTIFISWGALWNCFCCALRMCSVGVFWWSDVMRPHPLQ